MSVRMNVLLTFLMHVLIVLVTDSNRNIVVIVVSVLTLLCVGAMLIVTKNLSNK